MRTCILIASSLLALGASTAHAWAASEDIAGEASAADSGGSSAVGDIVVTAQKREQRITDVPMAITAYGEDFLERIGGTELSKLSAITPGFVIQLQDKFAPGFSIRGITTNDASPWSEQRVAVFQDNIAVTNMAASYGEMFDVDRVEIEKGPQSTLHGRSALNGGVSIFQKRPTDRLEFELRGGIGNYDYRHVEGVANLPLTDTLGIRFGALLRKRDGFIKDTDGEGTYNAVNAQAYRFAGQWEPSDRFKFVLVSTYDVDDTKGGVPFRSRTFLPLNQETGEALSDLSFWKPTHLNSFGSLPPAYFHREIVGVSGTAEMKLNDKLSMTSITGYRWFRACQAGDNDGTPTNMIAYHQCLFGRQVSEELRVNFTDIGPFEGFIGGSAFRANNGQDMDLGYDERAVSMLFKGTLQALAPRGLTNNEINALLGAAGASLKPFHLDRQYQRSRITTFDVFADATAHVTDALDIFAGGRVTWDKKENRFQGVTPNGPSTITGAGILFAMTPNGEVLRGENSSTIVTGRAGLRYALNPDVNLYAVYGIGKRPEILQLNANGTSSIIPAEELTSMEGGVKVRLLGGRLVGDASIYHYSYKNFQTAAIVNGKLSTINAGKADATGFEAQLNYAIAPEFTVFGSYGYNHARFKGGAYDGNFFRNSPDHKFAIGADLSLPLQEGTISFAPLFSWQSKMYFFDDNDRADLQIRSPIALSDKVVDEFQGGYGLLSARLTFTAPEDRWSVSLYGDNLADKKFLVDAGNTGDYFGIPTFITGTRRTVRVEFSAKF